MSFFRKFNRKKQKEFNYEEYNRRHKQEQEARRVQRAKAQLLTAWQNSVQEAVPVWQLWLALHIPPIWYKNLSSRIFNLIDRHATKYAQAIGEKHIAKWRLAMNLRILMFVVKVCHFVLIGMFRWVRDRILTFGVITTLTEKPIDVAGKKEYKYTLVVRYFWSEICRKEIVG